MISSAAFDIEANNLFSKPPIERRAQSFGPLPSGSNKDSSNGALNALGIFGLMETVTGQTTPTWIVLNKHPGEAIPDIGVSELKKAFGFNLSQFASILNCSRPQLNKWLNGDEPQKEDIRQRVLEVSSWLQSIPSNHAELFGKLSKRFVTRNETVLDILSKPDANQENFIQAYKILRPTMEELSEKLASYALDNRDVEI